ncbi:MAG: ribose ABC transporter substrate-binding protein RbsB [Clostridiaceae bacterium]
MKKSTKIMSIVIAGVMSLGLLAGCADEGNNAGGEGDKGKKIGMVISTLDNPFFVTMKDAAVEKAKELNYELVVLDSSNDAAKERSNVEDLVQQGVGVLIINPTDSDAVVNAITVANDAKIPVITVDRASNGGEIASHIASDNVAGGELAGEFLAEQLQGKGKVVELQGIPGASATNERGKGFHNIVDKEKGIEIVASQTANFDRQEGLNVMENIIQGNDEINGLFAHNDEMALGALNALKSAGMEDVVVIGFDGGDDAVAAVNSGEMAATVAQQPDLMGSLAIENAVKLIKGESVEKEIPVDLKLIVKE